MPEHVAGIARAPLPAAPLITRADLRRPVPGLALWDSWPLTRRDGGIAQVAGGELHMFLSAPLSPDPDERHALARIRLLHRVDGEWHDLGNLLPDGFAPGSREWAGSAVLEADEHTVTLYFTAAGERGEPELGFRQRIFATKGRLRVDGGKPTLFGWSVPEECFKPDGTIFMTEMTGGGAVGTIKAFRDPFWFQDPSDGVEYILFTGSLAASRSPWNGAVGVARRLNSRWVIDCALITADGVNNELERPHIVMQDGFYYLFWSTQSHVFPDGGPAGPTGLYGMVAGSMAGPWSPLNKTGLVVANPWSAPEQAYSWLVRSDLSVSSFANLIPAPSDLAELGGESRFIGVPAPPLHLQTQGTATRLIDRGG